MRHIPSLPNPDTRHALDCHEKARVQSRMRRPGLLALICSLETERVLLKRSVDCVLVVNH
jgi:hypothetical protein